MPFLLTQHSITHTHTHTHKSNQKFQATRYFPPTRTWSVLVLGFVGGVSGLEGIMGADGREPFLAVDGEGLGEEEGEGEGGRGLLG